MIRVLSNACTLAVPAALALAAALEAAQERAAADRWSRYRAVLSDDAPACAFDPSGLACVCADFTRRADAEAYYAAVAAAADRPWGLDFDGDGQVCEHLP